MQASLLWRLALALAVVTLQGCGSDSGADSGTDAGADGGVCRTSSAWTCAKDGHRQTRAGSTAQERCNGMEATADCFEHCCDMTIGEFKAAEADSSSMFSPVDDSSKSIGLWLNLAFLSPSHPDVQKCAVKPQSRCPLQPAQPQGAGAGETALMFGTDKGASLKRDQQAEAELREIEMWSSEIAKWRSADAAMEAGIWKGEIASGRLRSGEVPMLQWKRESGKA